MLKRALRLSRRVTRGARALGKRLRCRVAGHDPELNLSIDFGGGLRRIPEVKGALCRRCGRKGRT